MRVLVETRQLAFGPLGARVINVDDAAAAAGQRAFRSNDQLDNHNDDNVGRGAANNEAAPSSWSFSSLSVGGSLPLGATATDGTADTDDDRVLTWHLDSHGDSTALQLAEASLSRGAIGAPVELRFPGQAFASVACGLLGGLVWIVMLLEDKRVAWVLVPAASARQGSSSVLDVLAASPPPPASRRSSSPPAAVRFAALPPAVADVGIPTCLALAGSALCIAGTSDSVAVLPLAALMQAAGAGAADLSADLVMLSTGNWLLQRLASTLHLQRQHQLGAVAAASASYGVRGGEGGGGGSASGGGRHGNRPDAQALVLLHSDGTARAWDVNHQQQLGGSEALALPLEGAAAAGPGGGSVGGAGGGGAPPCRLRRACVVANGCSGGNSADVSFLVELVAADDDQARGGLSGGGAAGGRDGGGGRDGDGDGGSGRGVEWVLARLSVASGRLAVAERVRLSPPSPDLQVSSACLLLASPTSSGGSSRATPTLVVHAVMPEGATMMTAAAAAMGDERGAAGGGGGEGGGGGGASGPTPRVLAFDAADGSFQGRAHLLQQPFGGGALAHWGADQDLWAAAVRGEAGSFVLGQLLAPGGQLCRASLLDALERFSGGGVAATVGGGGGGVTTAAGRRRAAEEQELRRRQQLAELCAADARALAQRVRAAVAAARAGGGGGAAGGGLLPSSFAGPASASAAASSSSPSSSSSSDARLWHLFFAAYADAWARRHPALALAWSPACGGWVGVLRGGPQLSVLRPASRPEALLHAHPRLLQQQRRRGRGGGVGGCAGNCGGDAPVFRSEGERAVHSALRALRGALGKPALRAMTRAVVAGEGGDLLLVPRFVDLLVYGPGGVSAGGGGGGGVRGGPSSAAGATPMEPGAARRLAQWRERRRQALVTAREALRDVAAPLEAVAEAVAELEREEEEEEGGQQAGGQAAVAAASSAAAAPAAASSAAVAAALQAARARASLAQQLLLLLGVAAHHSGALGADPLGPDALRRAEGDLSRRLALVLRGAAMALWACRTPCSSPSPAPLAWGAGGGGGGGGGATAGAGAAAAAAADPPPLAAHVLPGFLRANPRLAAALGSSAGVGAAGAALARLLSKGPPVADAGEAPPPPSSPSPADVTAPDTAAARALRLAYRLYLARESAALDALCALAGPAAEEDPGLRLLRGLAAARGVRSSAAGAGGPAADADAAAGLLFRAAAALGTPAGLMLRDLLARLERRRAQDDGDVAAAAHAEAAAAAVVAGAGGASGDGGARGATPLAQVEYHEAVARLFAREGCPEAALAFCRAAVALVPRAFPAMMGEEQDGAAGEPGADDDGTASRAGRERAAALWSAALGHALALGRLSEAYDAAVAIPIPRQRADAVRRVVRAAAAGGAGGGGGGGGRGGRLADLCALPLAGVVRLPSSSASSSSTTTEAVSLLRIAIEALTERALADDGLALAQAGGAEGSPHAALHAFCVRWGAPRAAAAAALALARRLRAVARPGPAAYADASRAYDTAAAALGMLAPEDAWLDEDDPLLRAAAATAAAAAGPSSAAAGGGAGGGPPSGGRLAAAAAAAAAAARKRGPADDFGGDAQSPPGTRDVLSPSAWARGGGQVGGPGGGPGGGGGGGSASLAPDADEMADQLLRAMQMRATTTGGGAPAPLPATPRSGKRPLASRAAGGGGGHAPASCSSLQLTAQGLAREAALFRAAAVLAPKLPGLDALRQPGPPADYLLDQLLACGLFDEALELAPLAWGGGALAPRLERCVSAVAAGCARLQRGLASAAASGSSSYAAAADLAQLARPRDGATYLGPAFLSSPAAAAWDRLRALLARLDPLEGALAGAAAGAQQQQEGEGPQSTGLLLPRFHGRLRLAAAEAILAEGGRDVELPPWLLATLDGLGSARPASGASAAGGGGGGACLGGMAGGSADPSALLRAYLRHGRLGEAAALVLDHLAAWQRRGPLLRARAAACWFPWRQVGELCAALERRAGTPGAGGSGAELAVLRSRLVAAVDAHLRLAASDSAVAARPAPGAAGASGGGGGGGGGGGVYGGGGAGGGFLLGAA